MRALAQAVGTLGGIGRLRPAPGTWGSAAALPLAWLLHQLGGFPLLLAASLVLFLGGLWATAVLVENQADKDPDEIVVDEVVGQWIALLPVSYPAWQMGIEVLRLWPGWVAAFLLFRLLDIWKPGPVGRADRRGGPWGVMMDDVIAGVLAGLCVLVLAGLWHGVMAL